MSSSFDFDRDWIARLKTSLDDQGAEFETILAGGEKLNANSSRVDILHSHL